MTLAQVSLKSRALRLLSVREHSRAELEQKLSRYESETGALARTLDELQAKGFISEQRVLESVLHQRSSRLGSQRIKQELIAKGLAASLVRAAMTDLHASELARATQVWHKKFEQPPVNAKEHARQARFLAGRGFASDTVQRVMKLARKPASDTD